MTVPTIAPLFEFASSGLWAFSRGGRLHWYDLILLPLTAAIVFPDKLLDWIGTKTGSFFAWWHILLVEAVSGAVLAAAMALLMPYYPRLQWWYPILAVGLLGTMRVLIYAIEGLCGLRD